MDIVQGDHGLAIPFRVSKTGIENLTGATVEVAIIHGEVTNDVKAIITDPINGKCHFILTSDILTTEGIYSYQWTAYFSDGRIYNGRKQDFYASEKLITGIPGGGETTPVIIPFVRVDEFENLKQEFEELKALVESGGVIVPTPTIYDGGTFLDNDITRIIDGGSFLDAQDGIVIDGGVF